MLVKKLLVECQLLLEVSNDHVDSVITIATTTATFEGGLEQQAELMNKMATHVDVVVIITNQIGNMSDVSSNHDNKML